MLKIALINKESIRATHSVYYVLNLGDKMLSFKQDIKEWLYNYDKNMDAEQHIDAQFGKHLFSGVRLTVKVGQITSYVTPCTFLATCILFHRSID